MSEKIKVGMVSLGCSKNQVDAEHMLAILKNDGFELCPDSGLCDVVIINTCGFIEDAKKEGIENILEFATLKEEGRIKAIVVTGCLAERYQEQMQDEFPEVDVILGIGKNADIAKSIRAALDGRRTIEFGAKTDLSLEGERIIANLPFYAYLKIADGCDNCCSYCAIPLIRGGFRSRKIEDIVAEAKQLADKGVVEINVVAQDTTRFGEDNYGKLMLPELLRQLCDIDKLRWIRVLYCYPERITDELLDVMASNDKIVKYMDLPVQHASGAVLKRMNRRGDSESLMQTLSKIRAKMPDIALRTTCITGFPGETEKDFEVLCEFVKDAKFDRLGCFCYSQEEDTAAADFDEQLDDETKIRRSEIIMELQMSIAEEKGEQLIGSEIEVLVEGFDKIAEAWFGRSYMDAPDIDTKIFFTSKAKVTPGDFVKVLIEETMDYDLVGTRIV